ncbi:MAG: hypothetical protein R3F49_08415 [Planctomycetota bacterium]
MQLRPSSRRPSLRSCVSLALAATLASCTSLAFDPDRGELAGRLPGEDEAVVGLSGSYTFRSDNAADREGLDVRLEAGYHVAAEHELGGWLLGRYSNLETDAESKEELWGGLHYRYHWYLSDATSVYFGPTVGFANFDAGTSSGTTLGYGAQAGVRHWVSSTAALTLSPMVYWTDYDAADGGSASEVLVHWGVAFRF